MLNRYNILISKAIYKKFYYITQIGNLINLRLYALLVNYLCSLFILIYETKIKIINNQSGKIFLLTFFLEIIANIF